MKSLSTSISKVIISTVLSVSLIYSFLIVLYAWTIEDNIFNRLVNDEATFITSQFAASGKVYQPKADYMQLFDDVLQLPLDIQSEYPSNPNKIEYELSSGKTIHMTSFMLAEQSYFLLADVEQFEVSRDNMPNLLIWLLVFACIITVAALLMSLKIAKKITHPLNKLATAVNLQAANETKPVIHREQFPNNEIGMLADQVNMAFAQLNTALERERVFTKDISHEIRTPVAIIQNVLTASKKHQTIDQNDFVKVDAAVTNINQITSILLALARAESSQLSEVNLTAELETLIVEQFDFLLQQANKEIELNLHFDGDVIKSCNPNLVNILMMNLLSNLVRHASGTFAQITLDQTHLIFKNEAEQASISSVFQSGVKGKNSDGLGHGLNLIKRICEQLNWQLRVDQSDGYFSVQINF